MNILVLWEDDFPTVDAMPLTEGSLQLALDSAHELRFAGVSACAAALAERPDLFLTPYGSAFPKELWPAFTRFLREGGNWLNLGGAPLTAPVRREANGWVSECRQTAYGKALGINHCVPTPVPAEAVVRCPAVDIDLETPFQRFRPEQAWSLQVRLTDGRDFPEEHGSEGRRDGVLRPLAVCEAGGRRVAAPVVAIDRTAGAGGRWVLACCAGATPLPADLIGRLVEYAVRPHATVEVRPSFACYYPGEMAALVVTAAAANPAELKINLRVYSRDSQREIYAHTYRARCGLSPAVFQTSPFPAHDPGLYIVRATVGTDDRSKPIAAAETGFWVYDRDLIASGKPMTLDRDYFVQSGRPYPVTGTTYMAGDAHRKFLLEPNPAVWDADFAAMRQAGVNLVRTGLWTGWKRMMLDPGAMDECVLRAMTAFLLTARRYDVPVIFTFFAFLPDAWGGQHAFLDPAAVAVQTAFVAAFARRFGNVPDLLWDFINEPSFSDPAHLWSVRPGYTECERNAWARWLAEQGQSDDEWRERWRLTPGEPLDLPTLDDFDDRHIFQGTHPLRAADYRRFAQEMFTRWVRHMRAVVRENGNPAQLVTVGQDEGGLGERPGPQHYGEAVDFTCNHSWWDNDDLLWDTVAAKTADRPCLIEETGIMFSEMPDGSPSRTPEQARHLLERKMAHAFAAGGAGFVQWLWNTNVYLDSDNEAAIGFLRADGTEKPELDAFRGMARFFAANAGHMVGRQIEEACVLIPASSVFAVRGHRAAPRRAVRALEYALGVPCRAVAEHRAAEAAGARLIVVPAPRTLSDSCWEALLAAAERGATVLITGFFEADEYLRPRPRLAPFRLRTEAALVSPVTHLRVAGKRTPIAVRFGGEKARTVELARDAAGRSDLCRVVEHGAGRLYLCPVPVEVGDAEEPIAAVYDAAARAAGLEPVVSPPGVLMRRVRYAAHDLLLCVNESDLPARGLPGLPAEACVAPGRIALAFVRREDGAVISLYRAED